MATDRHARTDRDSPQTARAVRVRIASVRPGDCVMVAASRYRCSLPGHSWTGRTLAWPEKPPGGQVATVHAVDGYTTVPGGLGTDVVLLPTLGVVRGGGCRTTWRLQDHPPSATSASW